MRIRTFSSVAVLFVGLAVIGCEPADDGAMDEMPIEEPAMQDESDDGMMDTMEDTTMIDTTAADTVMADQGEAIEGEAVEE